MIAGDVGLNDEQGGMTGDEERDGDEDERESNKTRLHTLTAPHIPSKHGSISTCK